MRSIPVIIGIALALLCAGCGEKQQVQRPEERAQELVQQGLAQGSAGGGKVEVTAEGTRFNPPVELDQLPAQVWYCDMGTTHYARKDKGDGLCPVCGMTLSYRGGRAD